MLQRHHLATVRYAGHTLWLILDAADGSAGYGEGGQGHGHLRHRQPPQLPDHGHHAEDADGAEVGLHEQASFVDGFHI